MTELSPWGRSTTDSPGHEVSTDRRYQPSPDLVGSAYPKLASHHARGAIQFKRGLKVIDDPQRTPLEKAALVG